MLKETKQQRTKNISFFLQKIYYTAHMNIKNVAIITLLILAACLQGCLRSALPPLSPLDLSLLDTSPLKEKIIIIDPGHGGIEHGAVGIKGLRESEVNLGVALHLWGLLKRAGAHPILTRTADTSVLPGKEFILKQDLEKRSYISNTNNADLFISIHHNSATNSRKKNHMMIFYKISDPWRSRDIAREVLNSLKQTLQTETAYVLPGNYHVLRNTAAPAILGEASFMTNKKNEALLSFTRTLAQEAEAYFVGILNYYRKGVPVITDTYPDNASLTTPQPRITLYIHPGYTSASIDQSSIGIMLDGAPVTDFSFSKDGLVSFRPETPLSNNRHQYCITARNTAGNAAAQKCVSFSVALPPRHISATPLFPEIPADGMVTTPVDIEVLDELQRPVIDGTEVHVSSTAGSVLDPVLTTQEGTVRAILVSGETKQKAIVTVTSGAIRTQCTVLFKNPQKSLFMATIRDSSGKPVAEATLMRNDRPVALSDSEGFIYDSLDTEEKIAYSLSKKGYLPLSLSPELATGTITVENLLLKPIDNGVFFNRTVILDPAGSLPESLSILTELKNMIERAGGNAILTWSKPPAPSVHNRVRQAAKAQADIFLAVKITKKRSSIGYYGKSIRGKQLASLIVDNLAERAVCKKSRCRLVASIHYVVIHTSMPAVRVLLPSPAAESYSAVAQSIYAALRDMFKNTAPES